MYVTGEGYRVQRVSKNDSWYDRPVHLYIFAVTRATGAPYLYCARGTYTGFVLLMEQQRVSDMHGRLVENDRMPLTYGLSQGLHVGF